MVDLYHAYATVLSLGWLLRLCPPLVLQSAYSSDPLFPRARTGTICKMIGELVRQWPWVQHHALLFLVMKYPEKQVTARKGLCRQLLRAHFHRRG